MIADLKPYSEYKESGLPWLGQVPEHWEVKRLGALLCERGEKNDQGQVTDVLSLLRERGVIPYGEKGRVGNKKSEDITRYKVVCSDDIVVNCMNVIIGSVGLSRYTGCLSPVYYVLTKRFEEDNPRYLNAYFQTKPFQESLVRIGNGILSHRMRIPMELLKCELFPRPPADEQAAIVRFLDHATRRLERAILAKRKVIALLGEQRRAIIHRAVTRGLDPSVPLKPSGIPWLGDIPQHWELWRVSRFARVGNGSTPSRGQPTFWNGGSYPWLNSSQINRGRIDSADQFVTPTALRECHLPKVPAGSVLVAITGQGKTRGKSAVLDIEATINQHIAYITPRAPVASPEFIHLALTAAYTQLRAISDDSGSTKGALTCEDLKRFKLAFPPREEQDLLLKKILTETGDLNTAISRLEREIELLREYRTRLVADVVTGKLDVREAAARLQDEENADEEPDVTELDETDDQLVEAS
jgi:type I restriction enzyme S subunit